MKRVILWMGGAVTTLALLALAIFFFAPGTIVSLTQWQAARSAGLTSKSVNVDAYEAHYFEGGSGPVLVMLHGMGDDRHSFVATAAQLTDRYRVILPDMMGHGDNAADPSRDYTIAGQKDYIASFLEALDLGEIYLAGNSMGGHVSAAYALDHQDTVRQLILVNAPGLVVDDTVVYGGFGAPLAGEADFDALMSRVLHNPPSVPGPVKQHLIDQTNARMEFINAMASDIRGGRDHDLGERIAELRVPTMILWGEEDQVVPFAVAEAYAERIPQSELVLLPEAGHSPQMEAPERVAVAVQAFLEE